MERFEDKQWVPVRCVMCGSGGPLTKEHVLADFIGRHLDTPTVSYTLTEGLYGERVVQHEAWHGDLYAHSISVLCKTCNSEWGSKIHHKTAPLLKKLIAGQHFDLDEANRRRLARWVVYYTMIRQFIHPFLRAVGAEQRLKFRSDGTIPPGTRVWIAGYEEQRIKLAGIYRALMKSDRLLMAKVDGYFLCQGIGKFAIFAYCFADPKLLDPNSEISSFLSGIAECAGLVEVWPCPKHSANLRNAAVFPGDSLPAVAVQFTQLLGPPIPNLIA